MIKQVDLLQYLPLYVQQYEQIHQIMTAENPEFQAIWDIDETTRRELYFMTATGQGLSRFEKLVGLSSGVGQDIETRRARIFLAWNFTTPYTLSALHNTLTSICGENMYTVSVNYNQRTINVKIELESKLTINEVNAYLQKVIPANMIIDLALSLNKYQDLTPFTHQYLQKYTHENLRNEVLA